MKYDFYSLAEKLCVSILLCEPSLPTILFAVVLQQLQTLISHSHKAPILC